MKLIISVSPDPKDSCVVAKFGNNHKWEFSSTSITKGSSCFAFCNFPPTIATAGTDKMIRLWNPHRLSSPTSVLKGHTAPIQKLTVNSVLGHIISLCADKQVKIWDVRNQSCLQTIINSIRQYPDDKILSLIFNAEDDGGAIITSSNALYKYRLKKDLKVLNETKSHDYPVRKILVDSLYQQIVTGCDGSVVNIWVMTETGG